MSNPDVDRLVSLLKVLADASRLQILGLCAQAEHKVDDLATALALKAPTVSHHLKRLRELGLVTMRADGTQHLYRLDEATLQRLAKTLLAPASLTAAAPDPATYADRVMASFLVDGRLKTIPAQRKKRAIVLEFLARELERGRTYAEKEINAVIGQFHDDFATLRRELVMARLLAREAGVYTRTERDTAFDPHTDDAGAAA